MQTCLLVKEKNFNISIFIEWLYFINSVMSSLDVITLNNRIAHVHIMLLSSKTLRRRPQQIFFL